MNQKFILSTWLILFSAIQIMAQCRIVRVESSDSSRSSFYTYDTQGRLSSFKNNAVYRGVTYKIEAQYFYDNRGKLIQIRNLNNDTVEYIRNMIYNNNRIVKMANIGIADTSLLIHTLNYNAKNQLDKVHARSSKGDTSLMTYEYTPDGVFKRRTSISNLQLYSDIIEYEWDYTATAIDPERTFFDGYEVNLYDGWLLPQIPLSIKGNIKTWKYYKMDKKGQMTLDEQGDIFDFKANASGYLSENKYKSNPDNKAVTFYMFYEGCKN